MESKIIVIQGDITTLQVDAVVNAANKNLLGGGGVDGAIHKAAGPKLLDACKKLGGCAVGQAKYTEAFNLPADYVIHTVGPIWKGGDHQEDSLLANCYYSCLEIAAQSELKSIAFPSISTGAYGYPIERAADVAMEAIVNFTQTSVYPNNIIICCYSAGDKMVYQKAYACIMDEEFIDD